MDETRAVARLPHLDVEIAHRRLPDEGVEQVSIHLRASPSFGVFADYLERRPALWASLALSPFLVWQETMRAFWAPWVPPARALPRAEAQPEPEERAGSAKVHPFPGPNERNG